MQNSENDLLFATKDAVGLENKLLVAATVAAVLLAGSAIAYRRAAINFGSTSRLFWTHSHRFEEKLGNDKNVDGPVDSGFPTGSTPSSTNVTGQELGYNSTGTAKSSRSKDRRRRGKDPLREVLKSEKKLKSFPIPGSSSAPSSPAATLSSSLLGMGKQGGEADLYSSSEAASSSAALQTQSMDPSQHSPESERKQRQRELSTSTLATPTLDLSAKPLSRNASDVSCFSHEAEDDLAGYEDADFSITSSYRQYPHSLNRSQISLTQSSLSLPRSPSSLADVSELDPEDVGWVKSVSKSRPRNRARLADVMFEEVHDGQDRDGLRLAKGKGKARGCADEISEAAESTPVGEAEESSMFPRSDGAPVSLLSTDISPYPDTNNDTGHARQPHNPASTSRLPPPTIILSSEKNNSRAGSPECQEELPDPPHWDSAATPSQRTASSSAKPVTRDISRNEVLKVDTEGKAPEMVEDGKLPRLQPKGSNALSHASFSSAVTGGGGGPVVIEQSSAVSVTAAVSSTWSRLTETDDVSGASPSASSGADDGETEFAFPTLNSQASTSSSGPSTRTRSNLIGSSLSPSKKSRRFSSIKSRTPPPLNAQPLRTSSPPDIRENLQGPNGMPALSAQTQLASLRGALEAARLREEKHKMEMERMVKEIETLKWETSNSRRGEVELQAQVRQLTHHLQSYAALYASVAPHLHPHFTTQSPLLQMHPQAVGSNGEVNPADLGSSLNVDPNAEVPDETVDRSAPDLEKLEPPPAESQEEEAVPSLDQGQGSHVSVTPTSPQSQPALQLPSSPVSDLNGVSSLAQQNPVSPPPSVPIPAFFSYAVPYLPTQPPPFPVHPAPWMYHRYQSHHPTQNVSGTASGPSSPPQHYSNVYSPMMYPISPVAPPLSPLSPQSIGMMSHPLLHQHQPFGFGGGLRSTGASSAGSHSPEFSGPTNKKPKMKRRKSQMNGNPPRTSWEDVGDGWVGLSRVVMQPTVTSPDKGRRVADDGTIGEGEDDDAEATRSPYSELLADAILKRSSTIRPLRKSSKKENEPLDRQEGCEEVEPFTEFTFPSLSDFSNVYYRTASRTESSISSSLSSSPPSTTVTDFTGDPKWEEEKASLPPVIEKAEDSDPSVPDEVVQDAGRPAGRDTGLSEIQDIVVNEHASPKKEEDELSSTVSVLEQ